MRIRDYFSKPKGIREQNSLGITGIDVCRAANGADVAIFTACMKTLCGDEHDTANPISVSLFS